MTTLRNKKNNATLISSMVGSLLAVALWSTTPVRAEIYKSESPDGTPTFSDTPALDAREVQLPEGNVADPFAAIPALESEADPKPQAPHSGAAGGAGTTGAASPDYRPAYADDESGETRREVLDAEQRREVLNEDERREILDANERREVGEATPRHEVQQADPRNDVLNAGERREVGHEP